MTLYVDINTGEVRRSLTGPVLPSLKFYTNDIFPIKLVLVDTGVQVTSQYLVSGSDFHIALHGYPLTSAPIITASGFALAGQIAIGSLNLTAQALLDYFTYNVPTSATAWNFVMEVQVSSADGLSRQTFTQLRVLIARDLVSASVSAASAGFSSGFSTGFSQPSSTPSSSAGFSSGFSTGFTQP